MSQSLATKVNVTFVTNLISAANGCAAMWLMELLSLGAAFAYRMPARFRKANLRGKKLWRSICDRCKRGKNSRIPREFTRSLFHLVSAFSDKGGILRKCRTRIRSGD